MHCSRSLSAAADTTTFFSAAAAASASASASTSSASTTPTMATTTTTTTTNAKDGKSGPSYQNLLMYIYILLYLVTHKAENCQRNVAIRVVDFALKFKASAAQFC